VAQLEKNSSKNFKDLSIVAWASFSEIRELLYFDVLNFNHMGISSMSTFSSIYHAGISLSIPVLQNPRPHEYMKLMLE
jgi:hypothetical protein